MTQGGGRRGGKGRSGTPARGSGEPRKASTAKRSARSGRRTGQGRGRSGGSRQPTGLLSRRTFITAGVGAAGLLVLGASGDAAATRLNEFGDYEAGRLRALRAGATTPLLERFPGLAAHVPWRPLGALPTPIEPLPSPAGAGDVRLYVKRDDLSSQVYGGNKVRKLEHFLAEAEAAERRTLITLGGIGTNHGLATTLFGRRLGFDVRIAMFDQPVTPWVEQNLRAFVAAGAQLHYAGGEVRAVAAARELHVAAEAAGERPYFIMAGGSSRLGSIGYVNAAFELARQVHAGVMPEPDRIFVALGSGGTAAGLAVGCRLAGLRTRVSAVRVSSMVVANRFTMHWMANDLATWLQHVDAAVPRVRVRMRDFDIVGDQLGDGYGHPSAAGDAAMSWSGERMPLEPTYTAKALAACLAHCRQTARPGETVLYWNTTNAAPLAATGSLDRLPERLRRRL